MDKVYSLTKVTGDVMFAKSLVLLIVSFISAVAFADLNILAVGDTGKANEGQFAVGRAMARECRQIQCKFSLLLGDNIYDTGISSPQDQQMVEKFEKPYAEMPVPFYVTLGNHDYGKYANDWKKGDYQVQYSERNPNYILPSHYYTFEKNDVLFLVIDTSRLFHDKDTNQQIEIIRSAILKSKAKWKVAVGHHPYISNGKHGNAGNYDGVPFPPYSGSVVKKFVEKFLCGKVDIYISGHDHNLQTLPGRGSCSKTLFVVSGTGASEDKKLGNRNPSYYQSATLGFTSLKFTSDKIAVSHHNVEGQVLHTYDYKKSNSFFDFSNWF